jgi:peptidoglycan hydrolase-like protein with peptidoglycan-binding domain
MMLAMVSLAWAAKPAMTKRAPVKKTSGKSTAKKGGKKAPVKRVTWRNRQTAPTQARYREIQEALAAKGYLPAESANGVWSQTSIDALKRFQADQKIETTGKINALSLIALGLGPKRDAVVLPPAPSPAQ